MTRSMCLHCQVETLELGDVPQPQSASVWIGGNIRLKKGMSARCRRLLKMYEFELGRAENKSGLSGTDVRTSSNRVDLEQLEGHSIIVTAPVSEIVRLDL